MKKVPYALLFILSITRLYCTSELAPIEMSICPGGQLLVMCSHNGTLSWNVTVPRVTERSIKYVTSVSPQKDLPLTISDFTFNITRDSAYDILPLMSTLSIANVTDLLNGTKVECLKPTGSNQDRIDSLSYLLKVIIAERQVHPNTTTVTRTERFEEDAVTVFLEWMAEDGFTYNVSITPQARMIFSGTRVELNVSYNTSYDVSILAMPCKEEHTNILRVPNIYFVKCKNPSHWEITNSELMIIDHDSNNGISESDIFTNGAIIRFTCASGYILRGPPAAMCMENGEWEPDLIRIECKANCTIPYVDNKNINVIYNSTLEGSNLTIECEDILNSTATAFCFKNRSWSVNLADYDCLEDSQAGHGDKLALIATLTGVAVLMVTASLTTICIIIAINRKLKESHSKKLQVNIGPDRNESIEDCMNLGMGEYSLLQPHPPAAEIAPNLSNTQEVAGKKKPLVYADIGPRSLEARMQTSILDIHSHRVEYAQVNHHAQIHKQEPDSKMSMEAPDTLLNLDSLLIQLRNEVTPKWYQFGEAIGVEKEVLDKCIKYSPEVSIVEVLDNWLRNHAGQPTWREVAEALKVVGLQQLAFDIERVYDTGELPIKLNNEIPQDLLSGTELPPPLPPRLDL